MDDDFLSAEEEEEKLVPGERFKGYVIERRLGAGGAGAVYLARHEMLDTLYAIKIMEASESLADGESARRFVREAKIAARIQHPITFFLRACVTRTCDFSGLVSPNYIDAPIQGLFSTRFIRIG